MLPLLAHRLSLIGNQVYLYAHIRTNRPSRVLEFGSGVSTLVMALALEHNGNGRLVSLEPSEKWAASTRSAMPASLLGRAEIINSQGIACEVDGKDTVCFADQPMADPDMIYIDGAPDGARYLGAENLAALECGLGDKAVTVFVDARKPALHFFNHSARAGNVEITSYIVDFIDIRSDAIMSLPLGFDQFSNSRILWRRNG